MKKAGLLISIFFLLSCSDNNKGGLQKEVHTLELSYIAWACDCANWATEEDMAAFDGDSLAERSVFIEPANKELELPDTLGYNNDLIRFTGSFYREKGYPKGYSSFQNPEKARVLRYTRYEVIRSNFSEYQKLINTLK